MRAGVLSSLLFCFAGSLGAADFLVIDPGHGGSANSGSQALKTLSSWNNANSPSGIKEKDLTLELSVEIRRQIELLSGSLPGRKLACILTRETDENPDFAERAEKCAELPYPPTAIISIHFNASEGSKSTGTVAMVEHPSRNDNSGADLLIASQLTRTVSDEIANFFKGAQAREPITDEHLHGGRGSNFFYQLGLHPDLKGVPKCFLEVEFIDRSDTESQLLLKREEAFPKIARAIALWFAQYSDAR